MLSSEFLLLKVAFGVSAGLFAVVAAWFEVQARAPQKAERNKAVGDRLRGWWRSVQQSGFAHLPERVIEQAIRLKSAIAETLQAVYEMPDGVIVSLLAVLGLLGGYATWERLGLAWAIPISIIVLFLAALFIELKIARALMNQLNKIPGFLAVLLLSGALLLALLNLVLVILTLPTVLATAAITALALCFSIGILFIFAMAEVLGSHLEEATVINFSIAVSLSFSTTMMALVVGKAANPLAEAPQTLQMLLSNVLFDGLTLVATFWILSKAVGETKRLPVIVVVVLDLVVAALFACLSLWCALVFTDRELGISQVLHVLMARSPDGNRLELGPYFLAMHTTFLPTFLYLAVILACWVAKAVVLPVFRVLRWVGSAEEPYHLSAGLATLVAVSCLGISQAIGYVQEYAKGTVAD